jgi:hypothetical protein
VPLEVGVCLALSDVGGQEAKLLRLARLQPTATSKAHFQQQSVITAADLEEVYDQGKSASCRSQV